MSCEPPRKGQHSGCSRHDYEMTYTVCGIVCIWQHNGGGLHGCKMTLTVYVRACARVLCEACVWPRVADG